MSSRPKRVLSAHPASQRPFSGHSNATYSRKELIESVYTCQPQPIVSRAASAKLLSSMAAAGIEKSKKIVVKQSKRREQMEEEIMRLKRTVNGLTDELSRQKGKTQSMRKKGQQMSKVLNVEFENQAHWTSTHLNSHLIAGIKHAYDTLKAKHELLQQQHELLLKQSNITREIEHLAYIDALEHQNNALKQRLEDITTQDEPEGTEAAQVATYIIAELKNDRQRIAQKYKELQSRYQMCLETLKDRNKKVTFLEKLIIQKDNSLHSVHRENKRLKEQARKMQDDHSSLLQSQFSRR